MNLIQQLQQTPKWKEFEAWWNKNYSNKLIVGSNDYGSFNYLEFEDWCDFPFEMQEGVFRKYFLTTQTFLFNDTMWRLSGKDFGRQSYSIYDLIIWYFNN